MLHSQDERVRGLTYLRLNTTAHGSLTDHADLIFGMHELSHSLRHMRQSNHLSGDHFICFILIVSPFVSKGGHLIYVLSILFPIIDLYASRFDLCYFCCIFMRRFKCANVEYKIDCKYSLPSTSDVRPSGIVGSYIPHRLSLMADPCRGLGKS